MNERMKRIAPILVGAFFYLFSLFLLLPAQSSDSPWPFTKYLGVLLLAGFIVGAVIGWGLIFCKICQSDDSSLALPFATSGIALLELLAATFGFIGSGQQVFWAVVCILGYI